LVIEAMRKMLSAFRGFARRRAGFAVSVEMDDLAVPRDQGRDASQFLLIDKVAKLFRQCVEPGTAEADIFRIGGGQAKLSRQA
jgi:hypothetical protein